MSETRTFAVELLIEGKPVAEAAADVELEYCRATDTVEIAAIRFDVLGSRGREQVAVSGRPFAAFANAIEAGHSGELETLRVEMASGVAAYDREQARS